MAQTNVDWGTHEGAVQMRVGPDNVTLTFSKAPEVNATIRFKAADMGALLRGDTNVAARFSAQTYLDVQQAEDTRGRVERALAVIRENWAGLPAEVRAALAASLAAPASVPTPTPSPARTTSNPTTKTNNA